MTKKIICIVTAIFLILVSVAIFVPFILLGIKEKKMDNDYKYLLDENKIVEVKIDNVPLVKQEISCGYAIIEMISSYEGAKISEKELYETNKNTVTTSSTGGFVNEINKRVNKTFVVKDYLKNDELLLTINKSLLEGNLIAVEWAALLDNEWTLHWSVITGMDKEYIYVNNPYGYKEAVSYDEFISRTTFKAFENMPLIYAFGFAYNLFSKNTIIVVA